MLANEHWAPTGSVMQAEFPGQELGETTTLDRGDEQGAQREFSRPSVVGELKTNEFWN